MVFSKSVRGEAQFAHLLVTAKEAESEQLFNGGLDATAVIERLRHIITNDDCAPRGSTNEGRKLEAAHALASYLREKAEVTPKQGG